MLVCQPRCGVDRLRTRGTKQRKIHFYPGIETEVMQAFTQQLLLHE
jgi:hypothetical protein